MRNSLCALLGIELPATLIFDYPTIAALTAVVLSVSPGAGHSIAAVLPGLHLGSQRMPGAALEGSLSQQSASTAQDISSILREVQRVFGEVLGVQIGLDQPFAAAGLDSLAAVESRNTLNR